MTEELNPMRMDDHTHNHSGGLIKDRSDYHQYIRSVIAMARPVMHDDRSHEMRLINARRIWSESLPIEGTVAETYLSVNSFIGVRSVVSQFRFHPATLHEPTQTRLPALIAPGYNLLGEFVGIHRTFLSKDGQRRAKPREGGSRRMLGDCRGSYIQLSEPTGFRLVVAESIEMALAIKQACPHIPVWCSMTRGNMRAILPLTVKELILCVEAEKNDTAGAATLLMEAAEEHRRRGVMVLMPHAFPGVSLSGRIWLG